MTSRKNYIVRSHANPLPLSYADYGVNVFDLEIIRDRSSIVKCKYTVPILKVDTTILFSKLANDRKRIPQESASEKRRCRAGHSRLQGGYDKRCSIHDKI